MSRSPGITVALAQIAPRLGALDENLARHHELIGEARARGCRPGRLPGAGPDRLPAPGPQRGGRHAPGRPPLIALARRPTGCPPSSPSSRNRTTTGCSSRRRCWRMAPSATSTARSSCPPTACSMSAASSPRARACARSRRSASGCAWASASARTSGTWPRRSCWRSTAPRCSSTSPRRRGGTWPRSTRQGLGTATSWRTLNRTYAQLTTSYVVFVNRVGVDESITFWGGSEVVGPTGATVFAAPHPRRGTVPRRDSTRRTCAASASPRRCCATSGRRSCCASSTTSCATAEARSRRPVGVAVTTDADARRDCPSSCRRSWPSTRRPRGASSASSSAPSCARPASSKALLGLSGGIDSALVAYLVADAIGPEQPARRDDALPHLVARLPGGCGGGRAPAGLRTASWSTSRHGGRLLRGPGPRATPAPAARQPHGARPDDGALRPLGDLARAGRGHRQQDRDAHRLHARCAATAPAPSTPSATSTSPRCGSSRAAIGVPDAIIRKAPSADLWPGQTDEAEVGFSYAEVDRILFRLVDRRRIARRGGRRRLRPGARGARRPHGGGRGVQAPGAAHRQARTAHRGHRLPLPAPPPALDAWLSAGRRAARTGRARHALRRRHAHRQPGRHHAARARGAARGGRGRRRGHAPDAPPLGAPRHHDAPRQLPRPQRPGAQAELLARLAGGRRRGPRDGRRHAAGERPGRGAGGALGGEGGVGRAHPGSLRGAGGARGERHPGAALGVRGLPAAQGPRAAGAPGAHRRRRPGHGPVRGARPDRGDPARPGRGLRRRPARGALPRAHQAPRGGPAGHARRAGRRRRGRTGQGRGHDRRGRSH